MIWASPTASPLHAITRVADSLAIAECPVRFSSDSVDTLTDNPPAEIRCKECVEVLVERRMREWSQR